MTGNVELQTSSLKDIWRSQSLGTCASLGPTMTQCNTAHVYLNHYMEAQNSAPQILKGESCFERMGTLKPTSAYSRGDGDMFVQPA